MNTHIKPQAAVLYRTLEIDIDSARAAGSARQVEASLSSEAPIDRGGYLEILDHGADAVDLGRAKDGLPLLAHHDATDVIGIVENIRVVAGKLRGLLRFGKSRRALEVWNDVKDGILRNVSIGYAVKSTTPDGDTVRVTSWELLEASLVAIPADPSVGVNRTRTMENQNERERSALGDGVEAERHRVREIVALGQQHNETDIAAEAVGDGTPVEKFRAKLLSALGQAKPLDVADYGGHRDQRSVQSFSLLKAIRASVDNDWRDAGLEREIIGETQHRSGLKARGMLVPSAMFATRSALTAGAVSGLGDGSQMVATDHLADRFVDILRNETVVGGLGATFLADLDGDVSIPKMTAGATASWVAEGSAASESTPTFTNITMSPKTVSARVSYTRQMLRQASPDIENLLRRDLVRQIAVAVDTAALNGSGSSNQPTGVLNVSGIGSVALGTNGAAPTYAMLPSLEKEIAIDNALRGSLAFCTDPKVISKLRTTAKQSSGVEGNFVMNDDGRLAGYRVGVTNSMPSNLTKGSGSALSALIFGNWSDLLIGEWGAIDLLVDPYTNADSGQVRVVAFSFVDIAVRHAQSFAAVSDIVTT
ncbi:MAG: phage major capsid protein [Rhodospirillaceae bacterium]|nr:phage major capsid protein [Rhodospirillaceae bacterium]